MTTQVQKIQTIIDKAERERLFGEIHLRFRDGRLTFVTEERTTSFDREGTRDEQRNRY